MHVREALWRGGGRHSVQGLTPLLTTYANGDER